LAAGYCGEVTATAFWWKKGEFPNPRVREGRRLLWLSDDPNAAICPNESNIVDDIAEDL
jgi:hypothetical protein